jgi:hypothetical protein
VRRSWNILCGTAALVVALALPGIARADESTDGWTWNDGAAATDGWTWNDAAASDPAPATGEPAPDGWTWADTDAPPSDSASEPAPDGWTWDGSAESAPSAGS